MGVKNIVKRVGAKAGDTVSKLSTLSPNQVEEIQLQREQFLLEEPNPNDATAKLTTERMLAATGIEVFNAFLSQIKELYLPIDRKAEYDCKFDCDHNIRYINITKWVTDKKENSLEKLVNVYAVLSNEDCNIALIFDRKKDNTDVYLAVVNTRNADNNHDVEEYKKRLVEAIRGNFPGAEMKNEGAGILPCMDEDRNFSVACASNIPTQKSEKFISQTIEKLLDGVIPTTGKQEYTIVLLASPIQDVEERKMKLGEFYSGLVPYASWTTDFHFNDSKSLSSTATIGVNIGASAGVQNSRNYATTASDSNTQNSSTTDTTSDNLTETEGVSNAESSSSSHTDGTNSSETKTEGTSDTEGISATVGTSASQTVGASVSQTAGTSVEGGVKIAGIGGSASVNTSTTASVNTSTTATLSSTLGTNSSHTTTSSTAKTLGKTASDTLTKGLTNTVSNSVAKSTSTAVANTLGRAVTKGMSMTSGIAKSVSLGGNFGANFARSSTITATVGKSEGITQNFSNYNIKHALEILENQMKRFEQSTALGMWDFAAYVISEDQNVANNVAHSYLALTLGEESYMSNSTINLWRGKVEEEKEQAKEIVEYLKELRHPIFGLNPNIIAFDYEYNEYPSIVTATTSLSGKELAYSLNFPQHSIAGLPVFECAEFGRNVVTYDEFDEAGEIHLGKIFHMHHTENNKVALRKKSLASHVFITGSTGAGKSNTVYQLLEEAEKEDVKFLVIEPAKGEYKHVFGNDEDVSVYGTNHLVSPLLRINPFSFPKEIHVLEHMDRLVEIFNVCWPMYAAMPAVLKNALEKSYKDCGWDLINSSNVYGEDIYPSFSDVTRNIKEIIDNSDYDDENKGAYKGSLLTRLQSLTTGINGMIFCVDEIAPSCLFDENVIIDLSRVGSSETKSLIMGMLVLKLQEYRMSNPEGMNCELKHITVLEEAHNLLRRTSTEQSAEGSNLAGKSVEMISNAIAEMRTYGEGFIIADQAPGLMDMSVIRNTNTKIIMRLPDQSDRELVGKAANLNEDQIKELAKLPCGVAAVYQNEWVQPVLCKVDRCKRKEKKYEYVQNDKLSVIDKELESKLLDCIMNQELLNNQSRADITLLKDYVLKSKLETRIKCDFMDYIKSEPDEGIEQFTSLIYDFLNAEEAIMEARKCGDIVSWTRTVVEQMKPKINDFTNKQINLAMSLVVYEQARRDASYNDILCSFAELYSEEGRVY